MNYLLVIEDDPTDRALIQRMISKSCPSLELRFAADPFEAREMISQEKPAVVLLDLTLPKMSGTDFLAALMRSYPLPVIVMTGQRGKTGAYWGEVPCSDELVAMGAISVIEKASSIKGFQQFEDQLMTAINLAVQGHSCRGRIPLGGDGSILHNQVEAIAIGSSTGGPQALQKILSALPANCPPVIVAQHISEKFVASLVQGLNANSDLKVEVARDNVRLQKGHAYVASPHAHLEIGSDRRTRLMERNESDPFSPSINRLFLSLAEFQPCRVIACVLTGMGNDGAEGLLELRQRGARTIAQDESTSVVFGMPARAIECDAADQILPIDEIAGCIQQWCFDPRPALAEGSA